MLFWKFDFVWPLVTWPWPWPVLQFALDTMRLFLHLLGTCQEILSSLLSVVRSLGPKMKTPIFYLWPDLDLKFDLRTKFKYSSDASCLELSFAASPVPLRLTVLELWAGDVWRPPPPSKWCYENTPANAGLKQVLNANRTHLVETFRSLPCASRCDHLFASYRLRTFTTPLPTRWYKNTPANASIAPKLAAKSRKNRQRFESTTLAQSYYAVRIRCQK